MNDRLRLKVAIMAICLVSLISKGIVLERLTHKHDLLDVCPSFNIQNVDIKKTELEESLKMIMDKAALSKYFKNFSIQFVKTNYCKEPLIIVIDLRSIFENKEKPIGLYCSEHQQYFFIKEDSNRLWEKYFSYSGTEESVELRQSIVPDSVYITEPDVSFVCVAKIEGNQCKILYCEIDGKIEESDEAAEEAEPANPEPGTALTPGTFSLPSVGEVIDHPIAPIEPLYTTLMTRDYCGNYIYSNGTLERILTDNGYIQDGEYYFYIKDYQGNIRVVLNQSNQPVELNSYYPYGALMAAIPSENQQPYKYSAKELDRENGLDLYDSQARHYDPIIPRTTTMDPKSETYYPISPYTWCAGNPIRLIDPDGCIIEDPDGYIYNLQSFYKSNYINIAEWLSNNSNLDKNTKSLLQNCANLYKNKLSELEILSASNQIYRIEFSNEIGEGQAYTNFDPNSDKLITRINCSVNNSPGLVAHENEHWIQFESGQLSYNYITGDAGYLYDITDEVAAFNVQSVVENGIRYQIYDKKKNRIPGYDDYRKLFVIASHNRLNNVFRKNNNGKRTTIKSVGY